jgi:putative FmdB family regulatory protein
MPTYEYSCAKCKHTFETVQSITAKPLTVCPKDLCRQKSWGKGKVKRVISTGGGLIFKGSGFYTTDYRSDTYKAAAKKDAGASTSSSSSSDSAKKESKPSTPAAAPASPATAPASPSTSKKE